MRRLIIKQLNLFMQPKVLAFFLVTQVLQLFATLYIKMLSHSITGLSSYVILKHCLVMIFLLVGHAFFWRQLLKILPLKSAYPATALQIPMIAFAGIVLYEEVLTADSLLGLCLIVVGVFILLKRD